ncbi:MAG TPA: hypothetical protein HPP87_05640 [Planctomycetes bacterium]|nr:hypothetical protein [Planctomycetota bacterium]
MQKKLGYLFQKMDIGVCRSIESMFLRHEPDDNKIHMPFIAVCGIPRSGTTVTFQLMTQVIDGMLISNLHYLFYRTPLLGYWISKWITRPYISDYRSDFGFVAGLNGPAQAYYFWHYWCDQHLIETEPKPNKERLQRFIKLMNAIYKADGRPFLAGFQAHAFYLEELVSIFDKCLFVFVKRDMLSAARSMLMGMRKNDGTFVQIFSATPKESSSEPGETPYEKVARQAYFINRRIDEMKVRFPDIILETDYYQICRHPQYFVEELMRYLSDRGISFDCRKDVKIPVSFQVRHATREQDEETNKIAVALDSLFEKYGPVD